MKTTWTPSNGDGSETNTQVQRNAAMDTLGNPRMPSTSDLTDEGNAVTARGKESRNAGHDAGSITRRMGVNAVVRLATLNGLSGFAHNNAENIYSRPTLTVEDPHMEFVMSTHARELWSFANGIEGYSRPHGKGVLYMPPGTRSLSPERILVVMGAFDFMEIVARSRGIVKDPDPMDTAGRAYR